MCAGACECVCVCVCVSLCVDFPHVASVLILHMLQVEYTIYYE